MFKDATIREIVSVADRLDIEPAALLAVAEVESGGTVFARIGGRDEPLIRFEGHYFDKRLPMPKRMTARGAGLASPLAGGVPNPRSQKARWALLERAAAIDRQAAYESVSWGIGQVMGAHWKALGFAGIDELVETARKGVDGQADLMVRYIRHAGLMPALAAHDWAAFARGYNGPAYRRYAYHTKLAAAHKRHKAARP